MTKNTPAIHRASAADFKKIPGSPVAYWVSEHLRNNFLRFKSLNDVGKATLGMNSTNNNLFVRAWHEVSCSRIEFNAANEEKSAETNMKWFPYNKGGEFRKWYGNRDHLINWMGHGRDIHQYNDLPLTHRGAPVRSKQFQFLESASWSFISSGNLGVRYTPSGSMFDVAGSSYFSNEVPIKYVVAFLCSPVAVKMLGAINPTMNFQVGNIACLPLATNLPKTIEVHADLIIDSHKSDWDSQETSWDFQSLPLLAEKHRAGNLAQTYQKLRQHWREQTLEMQRLEEENNRIFIDAYGLAGELTPVVPLDEITLTCNPHYRYGGSNTEAQLEAKLLSDTMQELIHYAVGCMFGRYSLDKPGLILANQGEGLDDYLAQVPTPTFTPDADNVLPVLDDNWFGDDVVERFHNFLRITFCEAHYKENLAFIEEALGKDVRKYFTKDFYDYHVRRYKKRPIYWMFSSPKGTFNALIYMHRYKPDTVGVVLNDYLRDFVTKLSAQLDHEKSMQINGSEREKVAATKAIQKLETMLHELKDWERDVLYPLASERIEIDLDDGVKANYPKFGAALKPIKGMSNDDE